MGELPASAQAWARSTHARLSTWHRVGANSHHSRDSGFVLRPISAFYVRFAKVRSGLYLGITTVARFAEQIRDASGNAGLDFPLAPLNTGRNPSRPQTRKT